MSLIEYIKEILENDKGIRNMIAFELDEYTGEKYPAIAIDYVPEGMRTPYICIRSENNMLSNDHDLLSEFSVSIDIFVENDRSITNRLSKQVQELLHRRSMMPYATICNIDGDYSIPVSDISLSARSVRVTCREVRYEFIKKEEITWVTFPITVCVTAHINT